MHREEAAFLGSPSAGVWWFATAVVARFVVQALNASDSAVRSLRLVVGTETSSLSSLSGSHLCLFPHAVNAAELFGGASLAWLGNVWTLFITPFLMVVMTETFPRNA